MDNDNKIKIIKPEVRLFLEDHLCQSESASTTTYDLEKEYEKTKSNRSFKAYIVLGITAICIVLVSFAFYKYVQSQNEKIAVNVDAFEDLNLKHLLDSVSRIQNELNLAIAEKRSIEEKYATDSSVALQQRDTEIYMLSSMRLDNKSYYKQYNIIVDQHRRSQAFIDANYQNDIIAIDAKIEELSDQLSAMDSANLERAQAQQAELDSQRRVFEIEKQYIIDEYEAEIAALKQELQTERDTGLSERRRAIDTVSSKYKTEIDGLDPVIVDKETDVVLEEVALFEEFTVPDFTDLRLRSDLSESDKFLLLALQRKFYSYEKLSNYVTAIPQKNSIGKFSNAMEQLSFSIGNDIKLFAENILNSRSGAQNKIINLQSLINSFGKYIDSLLQETGDTGLVLDASDANAIVVYISPLYAADVHNKTAYVFRKDNELVATVTLKNSKDKIIAVPQDGSSGWLIQSGDRILIDLAY